MADETAVVEEGASPAENPLVAVTFEKNINRTQKYLEAEPKALGITQIGLSVFQITSGIVFLSQGLSNVYGDVAYFITSLLVIVAGSVAIAAKNLRLPTLRACLGMQIVACGASLFNLIYCMVVIGNPPVSCWHYYYYSNSSQQIDNTCQTLENVHAHYYAEGVVINVVLLAISAALAAYCCKVVNCCGPASKMMVITVQSPAVQE